MKIPFNIWKHKKQKSNGEDAKNVLNDNEGVSVTITIGETEYTIEDLKPKSTITIEERARSEEKRMLRYKRAENRERKLIIWRILRYMITYRDLSLSSNFYEYKKNITSHNHAIEELNASKPNKYFIEAAIRFCRIEFRSGRCEYELTEKDIDRLKNWDTKPIDTQKILNDVLTSYKDYWNSVLDSYTHPSARNKRLQYLLQNLEDVMNEPYIQDNPNVLQDIKDLYDHYKSLLE